MASKTRPEQDAYDEILKQLLTDVLSIREQVSAKAEQRLQLYKDYYRSGVFTKSATNLAHYLALRQFDLRHLQSRLAQSGLSSLGRAEASVMSTLDSVIYLLRKATRSHSALSAKNPSEYGFNRGQQLLEQHTIELFGAYFENSKVHAMVTLSTEAAWNYELICALMSKGMTCARINCAHDSPTVWQAMIRNVRRAEVELGRVCRILMDLAGHKIRTGAIAAGPAVHHIKTRKSATGEVIQPGSLVLCREKTLTEPTQASAVDFKAAVPDEIFEQLSPGLCLRVEDARQKSRWLTLTEALNENEWLATCDQGIYLTSGSRMELFQQRPDDAEQSPFAHFKISEFSGEEQKIRVHKDDFLILTKPSSHGRPADYSPAGQLLHPARIGCTLSSAINKVKVGQAVWIDDGKIGCIVEEINDDGVLLRVTQAATQGVKVMSDKGINFPETQLALPSLSDKDLGDLDFVCSHADLVGFSFVESLADMEFLIAELAKRRATDLPIIAKIETNQAVKNLPEIIFGTIGRHSLGIMIARGDLAVELGSARLAEIQEEILWLCEAAHIPVIWATQVLESIAKKGTRSRPEFTDAAMAVRAECVMLNKGPYIVDALEALINVMNRMQEHQHKKFPKLRALHW